LSFILLGYWGKRLRKKKKFSLPEVIEEKFGIRNKYLITLIIFLVIICFMGIQLKTAAIVMNSVVNIPENYAILLMCGIVVLYTFFAGLLADIYTDTLQLAIIILALILSSCYIYNAIGGFQMLKTMLLKVSLYGPDKYFAIFGQGTSIISTIILFLGTLMLVGLTIFTDPALHQRIYAAKNTKEVKNSGIFAGISYIIFGLLIVWVTIGGNIILGSGLSGEHIIPELASGFLPPILGGLLLAALLSASMSTIDSDFLLLSTVLVNDYYRKKINPIAKDKDLLNISRALIILFGALAVILALISPSVINLLPTTWVFLVASISVSVFCVIFNKGNDLGATLSILGGFLSAVFIVFIFKLDPVQYFLFCVLISALAMIIGTNIRQARKYLPERDGSKMTD